MGAGIVYERFVEGKQRAWQHGINASICSFWRVKLLSCVGASPMCDICALVNMILQEGILIIDCCYGEKGTQVQREQCLQNPQIVKTQPGSVPLQAHPQKARRLAGRGNGRMYLPRLQNSSDPQQKRIGQHHPHSGGKRRERRPQGNQP